MANQSAKKNQIAIRGKINFMKYTLYPLIAWLLSFNLYFLINETISYWHFLFCLIVGLTTHLCIKQTIKCWEFQLPPQASEYYLDILAMNSLVALIDPYSHKIWHLYWLILVFVGWQVCKWLWDYITPKYEENEEESEKKKSKEKKEKIKYIKK